MLVGGVKTVDAVTVKIAGLDVTLPAALETTTVYVPAAAFVTLEIVRVDVVTPEIGEEPKNHW